MDDSSERIPKKTSVLQVMICTYGHAGLERIANSSHPEMDGVEYLVSLQLKPDEGDPRVPEGLCRPDFTIISSPTKGLCVNRNLALSQATAPLLLVSDDDVDYTEEGLRSLIRAFSDNPDADLITFRYDSDDHSKYYPDHSYSLSLKKEHFISSIEIAFRRNSVRGHIWFNENFGIGAVFPAGEEDVFLKDCINAGLNCMFIPTVIARHDGPTTSRRTLTLPSRPQTKGAVFLHLYPYLWPLRMLTHALREIPLWRKGLVPSPLSYCRNWLIGVKKAKTSKFFPTPDYSHRYTCHD